MNRIIIVIVKLTARSFLPMSIRSTVKRLLMCIQERVRRLPVRKKTPACSCARAGRVQEIIVQYILPDRRSAGISAVTGCSSNTEGKVSGRVMGKNTLRTEDTMLEDLWRKHISPVPHANPVLWKEKVSAILAEHGYKADVVG